MKHPGENESAVDSLEPGPFQKYLFSGACYIQIGECFRLIRQSVVDGTGIEGNSDLEQKLRTIWTEFLIHQPGSAMPDLFKESENQSADEWKLYTDLHNEVTEAGKTVTDEFLASLKSVQADDINMKLFFMNWACACDSSYQKLIRSESFSRVVGRAITSILVSMNPDNK